MAETGTDTAAASYLAEVRVALADLPATEVAEILDDIGPHVAEVAAELGPEGQPGRLHERLGPPRQYAAELRAAAGYPSTAAPAPAAATTMTVPRLALWLLGAAVVLLPLAALTAGVRGFPALALLAMGVAGVSLLMVLRHQDGLAAVAALPEVGWLRERNPGGVIAEYARLFQPGWWLLRAGLAATALVYLAGGGVVAIALLTVPLALGSVWLGRRSQADRRWLWGVLPLNAFAVAFGLVVLAMAADGGINYRQYSGPYSEVTTPQFGNIYPYDSNGRPLSGVYLYDETGQPITSNYYNSCVPTGRIPVPANRYPQPEYDYDGGGECVVRSVVPTPAELPSDTAGAPTTGASTSGATATGAPTSGATGTPPAASAPPVPTTTK